MKIDGHDINAYLNVEIENKVGDTYHFIYAWRGKGDTVAISKFLVEQMLHEHTMNVVPVIGQHVFVGPFKLLTIAYVHDTWILRRVD